MALVTYQNIKSMNLVQINSKFAEHVIGDDEDWTVSISKCLYQVLVVLTWANDGRTTSEIADPASDLFFPVRDETGGTHNGRLEVGFLHQGPDHG